MDNISIEQIKEKKKKNILIFFHVNRSMHEKRSHLVMVLLSFSNILKNCDDGTILIRWHNKKLIWFGITKAKDISKVHCFFQ
jgi:hypothetical protein